MASRVAVFAVLCIVGVAAAAIPKGELVEWDLNLFEAANKNKNARCESFHILYPPGHYAGYYSIDGTQDGHLFYMYFENRFRDPDAPFVFWTNGGPGCSAFYGLFLENGPYDIQDDFTVCWKKHGWDVGHNIVFVEQPINVGYSYSSSSADKVFDEKRVGDDMVAFFKAFLKNHPELKDKDLYLSGESFGGHYLPFIAKSIILSNKRQDGTHLNLKGVFMVDPWTSPSSHYYSYPIYAYDQKLIGEDTRDQMLSAWPDCDNALKLCEINIPGLKTFFCNAAYAYCQSRLFSPVIFLHPFLNYYDIRRRDCKVSGCYDVTQLTEFMNDATVKSTIGADHGIDWEDCKTTVRREMGWDVATDSKWTVANILNTDINVSVVVGDQDFICNYLGNERWVDTLVWNKSEEWTRAEKKPLMVGGKSVGYVRETGPLTFVLVEQAGHMVPMDQPEVGLALLTAFTRGEPYPTYSAPSTETLMTT